MENEIEDQNSLESILVYAPILWHWAWLLLLSSIIAGLSAYFISNQQIRIYQSSTLVMVNNPTGASLDSYATGYQSQQLTTTYANTLLAGPILDSVSQELGFKVSADSSQDFAGTITVLPIVNTSLIRITVTDPSPQKAAQIANTLVSVFSRQVQIDQNSRFQELISGYETEISSINQQIEDTQVKLTNLNVILTNQGALNVSELLNKAQYENVLSQYQQARSVLIQTYQQIKLAEVQSTSSLIQKDPAIPNNKPIKPLPLRNGLLGAIVGLMLAAGTVYLLVFLDDTINNPEEITRRWGVPILGIITRFNSLTDPIITMSKPRSPVAESYRSLRTNLQFAEVNKPLHTLLVTSPLPSDGKTSVVANLATVFVQKDQPVIVIDCDLRRPRLHKVFQLSNRVGLTEHFLHPEEHVHGLIKKTNLKGLSVITSGNIPPNPSELLNSEMMVDVIKLLSGNYHLILLDSPPLLAVTDALLLASKADGVLLVIDPKNSKRRAIKLALNQLRRANANLVGIVINNVKNNRSNKYYSHQYYSSEAD
ncbi:MAG: polysaccharide biosynthesis tyrosine autokinase [Chloroflexi bacterium]|nr:polysaccharide biosynthesis tyrosine autokinase [Chloroflexota bacterium]